MTKEQATQKAKEIAIRFLQYWLKDDKRLANSRFDDWASTPEAQSLISELVEVRKETVRKLLEDCFDIDATQVDRDTYITSQLSAMEQGEGTKWVKASERLPEVSEGHAHEVIINSHINKAQEQDVVVCGIFYNGNFYICSEWNGEYPDDVEPIKKGRISHWQELPPPHSSSESPSDGQDEKILVEDRQGNSYYVNKKEYWDNFRVGTSPSDGQDWISVGNQPEDKWVLLYNGNWIGVGKFNNKEDKERDEPEWQDETSEYISPDPTHWMPLPKPPSQ